jgi:hypothetical protein
VYLYRMVLTPIFQLIINEEEENLGYIGAR